MFILLQYNIFLKYLKNLFTCTEPEISTSVALTRTELYTFIPIYILKVFSISFAWFT